MPKTYVERHIDFAAIETEMAEIEPRKITLAEVLGRLAPQIHAMHKRGVTVEQIRDVLKRHKIQASITALNQVIEGRSEPPVPARSASSPSQPVMGFADPPA